MADRPVEPEEAVELLLRLRAEEERAREAWNAAMREGKALAADPEEAARFAEAARRATELATELDRAAKERSEREEFGKLLAGRGLAQQWLDGLSVKERVLEANVSDQETRKTRDAMNDRLAESPLFADLRREAPKIADQIERQRAAEAERAKAASDRRASMPEAPSAAAPPSIPSGNAVEQAPPKNGPRHVPVVPDKGVVDKYGVPMAAAPPGDGKEKDLKAPASGVLAKYGVAPPSANAPEDGKGAPGGLIAKYGHAAPPPQRDEGKGRGREV